MREEQPETGLRSGEAARRCGVSPDTLRHYERLGLLPKPRRTPSGYRLYAADTADRVRVIRAAVAVGFTLVELAAIFRMRARGEAPCRSVRSLARAKLADLEARLSEMQRLRDRLHALLTDWESRIAQARHGERVGLLEPWRPRPLRRDRPPTAEPKENPMTRVTTLCLALLAAPAAWSGDAPCPLHAAHAKPAPASYAGEETRAIKSLSAEEIAGYQEGRGMGLARPAELNHYPGPRHVLDLAADPQLTDAQREAAQKAFDSMRAQALPLGARLVDAERRLDEAFASGRIDEDALAALVEEAARVQGQLRAVHLGAHLAMRRLLSPEQIARYDALRGYGAIALATP